MLSAKHLNLNFVILKQITRDCTLMIGHCLYAVIKINYFDKIIHHLFLICL